MTKAIDFTHLPAAKMVPFAEPKVEMATESGMIHAKKPNMRLPKVCKDEVGSCK